MAKIRVLLLEDDISYSRLVEAALATSEIEFDVVVAERLEAALDALTNRGYNLVLLDLNVPDSKGLATLEAMVEVAQDIPIIVLTGQEDNEFAKQTLSIGAQRFLRKTEMSTSSLIEVMRQAVALHRQLKSTSFEQATFGDVLVKLEQSADEIENALAIFGEQRFDPPETEAINVIRTHASKMKATIRDFRTQ